jgi:hypothetical protein
MKHIRINQVSESFFWKNPKKTRLIMVAFLIMAVFILVSYVPTAMAAQEESQEDKWQFDASVYLFMASIGGESASGGDIEIDFNDLLDNLDMGFMGTFGARKNKWSFVIDGIYLDVKADKYRTVTGLAIPVNSSVELKGWVVTPVVGYRVVETEKVQLDILAGARYLWLETEVAFNALTIDEYFSDSDDVLDGIVGVRGQFNLTEKWYIPFLLDVGTGNTDLTWQAMAGLAYKFKKVDIVATYRYLDWDFDDSSVFKDMNFKGPLVGVKFAW